MGYNLYHFSHPFMPQSSLFYYYVSLFSWFLTKSLYKKSKRGYLLMRNEQSRIKMCLWLILIIHHFLFIIQHSAFLYFFITITTHQNFVLFWHSSVAQTGWDASWPWREFNNQYRLKLDCRILFHTKSFFHSIQHSRSVGPRADLYIIRCFNKIKMNSIIDQ